MVGEDKYQISLSNRGSNRQIYTGAIIAVEVKIAVADPAIKTCIRNAFSARIAAGQAHVRTGNAVSGFEVVQISTGQALCFAAECAVLLAGLALLACAVPEVPIVAGALVILEAGVILAGYAGLV